MNVEESALTQLAVTRDYLEAMDELVIEHDLDRVYRAAKAWVLYIDRINEIMTKTELWSGG